MHLLCCKEPTELPALHTVLGEHHPHPTCSGGLTWRTLGRLRCVSEAAGGQTAAAPHSTHLRHTPSDVHYMIDICALLQTQCRILLPELVMKLAVLCSMSRYSASYQQQRWRLAGGGGHAQPGPKRATGRGLHVTQLWSPQYCPKPAATDCLAGNRRHLRCALRRHCRGLRSLEQTRSWIPGVLGFLGSAGTEGKAAHASCSPCPSAAPPSAASRPGAPNWLYPSPLSPAQSPHPTPFL